jgi:hypothetical protein
LFDISGQIHGLATIPAGEEFPAQTEQKGGYVGQRFRFDVVMQRRILDLLGNEPGRLVLR